MTQLVLASSSPIRATLLSRAGIAVLVDPARVDEPTVKQSMLADHTNPRDLADALAELKASRVATRHPDCLVVGCDQLLELDGEIFSKPEDRTEAARQLARLSGRKHQLHTAAVIWEDDRPVWRYIGLSKLTMRRLSVEAIDSYLDRNWPGVGDSVGAYRIEEEGVRLFHRIEGQYFHVLGLPLMEIIDYLYIRGTLQT